MQEDSLKKLKPVVSKGKEKGSGKTEPSSLHPKVVKGKPRQLVLFDVFTNRPSELRE